MIEATRTRSGQARLIASSRGSHWSSGLSEISSQFHDAMSVVSGRFAIERCVPPLSTRRNFVLGPATLTTGWRPIVLVTTPPQPASKARWMLLSDSVGGADASRNGFTNRIPVNTVDRSATGLAPRSGQRLGRAAEGRMLRPRGPAEQGRWSHKDGQAAAAAARRRRAPAVGDTLDRATATTPGAHPHGVPPTRQDRPRRERHRLRGVGDRRVVGDGGRRRQPSRAARRRGRGRDAHRHRGRLRRRAQRARHPAVPRGAARRVLLRPDEDRPPRAARRPRVHPGRASFVGGPEPREPGHGHPRPRPAPLPPDTGLLHARDLRGDGRAGGGRLDRPLRRLGGEGRGGPQGARVPGCRLGPDRVQRVPPAARRPFPRRGAAARRGRARPGAARERPAHRQAHPRDGVRGDGSPPVQPARRVASTWARRSRAWTTRPGSRPWRRSGRSCRPARRSPSSRCAGSSCTPASRTTIPGAKTPEQARANAAAADLAPLDDATMARIREIYETRVKPLVHQRW